MSITATKNLKVYLSTCFSLGLLLASSTSMSDAADKTKALATFAGGCFWCMEKPYDQIPGVSASTPGYAGGSKENAKYEKVSAGQTKHVEAVQISYDPTKVEFKTLVETFWMNVDPTDAGGQFVDRGAQYRPVIYFHDEEQQKQAQASKEELIKSNRFKNPVIVEILPYTTFFPAEEYHQDYYKKNPTKYKFYRFGSGRDQFLEKAWKKKK